MNVQEIKAQLADRDAIAKQPFRLLQEIARLFNAGSEHEAREMVLRALEHRDAFVNYQSVLDSLVRELGLFPYIEEDSLSLEDSIAYEYHRPLQMSEPIVFHREQAEIYRRLLDGDNIILSAPTSFGKSKIIDAIIASRKFKNIVVIVPTLALIDETRRRLSTFSSLFKIITQVSQQPATTNIFVFTAERANVYEYFPKIDFFVIDEFYKIGALAEDQKRTVALNQAFYKLSKGGAQFYLLGPCVKHIPEGLENRFHCSFFKTTFATVASDEVRVKPGSNPLQTLCDLVKILQGESTLIFCKSPKSTNEVAQALLAANVSEESSETDPAVTWMKQNFHHEWLLPRAIHNGIGIHHGRLPRSLAQYVVRAFNREQIHVLACTSTLIEGVNTKAKNVIIYDNAIAREKIDFFTFNNIRGRSGRMFEHFIGRVFLFHHPPQEELPFVDFPFFTQRDDMPDSILVQLDASDMSDGSKARLEEYIKQSDLPMELLKKHSSFEPDNLISLARTLKSISSDKRNKLSWSRFPDYNNLELVCSLIWDHLIGHGSQGVFSAKQLAFKVFKLQKTPDIKERILDELTPGPYEASSVDEAVERVFEFDRSWASFELPRMLRAFSDIRKHVHGGSGDYSFFAGQLENLFRPSFQVALEEFGVPLQVSDKLTPILKGMKSIDDALQALNQLPIEKFKLDAFERELVEDFREAR